MNFAKIKGFSTFGYSKNSFNPYNFQSFDRPWLRELSTRPPLPGKQYDNKTTWWHHELLHRQV